MPLSFDIEVVTSSAGFAGLREEWDRLLERSEATVFQTWEWLFTWWRRFGRGRLRILALRSGGELVGLAPLFVARYGGTPLRRLAFLGTGASDYLQFLVASEVAREGTEALLARVAAEQRRYDFCDFQQIPEGSPLADVSAPAGVETERFVQEVCPFVPLPATWERFSAGLGKKLRANLAYYRRRLEREFRTEWIEAGERDLGQGMDSFFQLHQSRWNRRWLPGAFAGARSRAFHREAAAALLERGWLRLHLFRLDGRDEAALYCFNYRRRGYYYLGGFEPRLARYSLGTVLTARAIERAITDGATEFDFLRGDEPYKYAWEARDRQNRRWLWWKPGVRGALARWLNRLERRAERRIKAFARSRRGT